MVGIWSDKEKQDWLLEQLREEAKNTGNNQVSFEPITVTDGEDDFAATLFHKSEQEKVLYALAWADLVEIKSKEGERPIIVVLTDPPRPQKSLYARDGYKTLRDVLLNYELRTDILGIICRAYSVFDPRQIKKGLSVKTEIDEKRDGSYQDEKVLLMEELEILRADWEAMKKQTHRTVGNRLIPVSFNGEKVAGFIAAAIGLSAVIKPKALGLISEAIVSTTPDAKWFDLLIENDVPDTLFFNQLEPKEMLADVFTTLLSTGNADDVVAFKRVLETVIHPLFHGGDEKRAAALADKLNGLLKYDGLVIRGGKVMAKDDGKSGGPWANFPAYVDLLSRADYLLHIKAFAAMLYDMLEATGGGHVYILNERLNHIYTIIHHYLGVLLERPDGAAYRDEYNQLPDSLLDLGEDFDMEWEYGQRQALSKIIAATSKEIILESDPSKLMIPAFIQQYQKDTTEIVMAHKKHAAAAFQNMLKGVDKRVAEQQKTETKTVAEKPKEQPGVQITNIINNHVSEQSVPAKESGPTTQLKDLVFDDETATLRAGDRTCTLPPHKNEHFLCREMFKYRKGEPVDWSVVYKSLEGRSKKNEGDQKKMVYDTIRAVNARTREVLRTKAKIFAMKQGSVVRMA